MKSAVLSFLLTMILKLAGFLIFALVLHQLGITPSVLQWILLFVAFMIMQGRILIKMKDQFGRII